MTNSTEPSLFKAKLLLVMQFVSDFGDQITIALMQAFMVDISTSTSKTGLVYVLNTLAFILFTFFGGAIGDRFGKKYLILVTDFCRAFVVVVIIVALKTSSIGYLYIASFLLAILGSLNKPAKQAVWSENIPITHLKNFNGNYELSFRISAVAGPILAGFFAHRTMISLGFGLDALTFIFCALGFAFIIGKEKARVSTVDTEEKNFLCGFRAIGQKNEILKYVLYDAIQMVGFGAILATFFLLVQRDFSWSKELFTKHLAVVAIFCALGAWLGKQSFANSISNKKRLFFAAIVSAFSMWFALYSQSFFLTTFFVGICNAAATFTLSTTRSEVQLSAKKYFESLLSSILAARIIIIRVGSFVGATGCIFLDHYLGLTYSLAVFTSAFVISVLPLGLREGERLEIQPVPQ